MEGMGKMEASERKRSMIKMWMGIEKRYVAFLAKRGLQRKSLCFLRLTCARTTLERAAEHGNMGAAIRVERLDGSHARFRSSNTGTACDLGNGRHGFI